MNRKSKINTGAICATVLVVAAIMGRAGPLDPPPGPVSPSGRFGTRTEIDSLPFSISFAGSYYLAKNLTGVAGQNGITVNADDVTIDLEGFTLIGVAGTLDGIKVGTSFESRENVAIRNGTVRDWGEDGVDASFCSGTQLADLRAFNNGSDGLRAGDGGTITTCQARSNTDHGIVGGGDCTISGCTASYNGGTGVFTGFRSTVIGCTASINTGDGFFASSSSTVIHCTAATNGNDGIAVNNSSTVTNCTASFNTGDGIDVPNHCRVVGNNCGSNGRHEGDGAGIHARFAGGNRIEGNNVTGNDRGIDVDLADNIIIKNTAHDNNADLDNYSIVAGNRVGTITDDPTTAGPWYNFGTNRIP